MVQGIPSKYGSLGVDVEKRGIDRLKALTNDLFPQAFCTVTHHPTKRGVGAILHADGAGTKPIVAYLYYKETGSPGAFSGLAQDVVAMNVDDIVFYDPKKLYNYADKGAAILMAKPKLPFGRILTSNTHVIRFEQKPLLDFYVNAGHYVFQKSLIEEFFPEKGDMELQILQILADKRMLKGYEYKGLWLTINTMKDLLVVREYFSEKSNS